MGDVISIASNPRFKHVNGVKIDAPIKTIYIKDDLIGYREGLSDDDYLEFLEGVISPYHYGFAEEEIQDLVDGFYGLKALTDAE